MGAFCFNKNDCPASNTEYQYLRDKHGHGIDFIYQPRGCNPLLLSVNIPMELSLHEI